MKFSFYITIFIIFYACGQPQSDDIKFNSQSIINDSNEFEKTKVNNNRTNNSSESFEGFYYGFISSLNNKELTSLNHIIHPDYGLWIVESSGAMPSMKKNYDFNDFISNNKKLAKTSSENLLDSLLFESLPNIICEKEIYSKNGVFADTVNILKKSQIWNYSNLNEKQIHEIEFTSDKINYTVVNTYFGVFYFAKIDSKWYLSVLDIRTPCEA